MPVWIDGALIDAENAKVRFDDHGVVVGDGAFETLKTVRGEPFAVTRHLRRLRRTLDAMSIPAPDTDWLRGGVEALIGQTRAEAARLGSDSATELRVRLTVTAGAGSLGSAAPGGPPSTIIAATPLPPGQPTPYAVTVAWTRNERGALAGLKTTSYAENVRALRVAHQAGASEAIFANTVGNLCEGTGTNVFVVVDGECITPPLSAGPLAGVTRELVFEAVAVTERDLPMSVLETAEEVFLTSSTRDVQALTRIDDRELGVGPVTEAAAKAFADVLATSTDP